MISNKFPVILMIRGGPKFVLLILLVSSSQLLVNIA